MKQEVKEKWVAALRSGEYLQGKGHLRLNDEFCCLGVLCDLAVKDEVIAPPVNNGGIFAYGDDHEPYFVPDQVAAWAEFENDSPLLDDQYVVELNDDEGLTFPEIADLIEEKL